MEELIRALVPLFQPFSPFFDKEAKHLSAAIFVFQGQKRCYYVFQLSNFSLVHPLRIPPESSASDAVMATVWLRRYRLGWQAGGNMHSAPKPGCRTGTLSG